MADAQPEKIKTILNSSKLRLKAPCPTCKGKWSELSYDLYMGHPRMIVNTNDDNLKNQDDGWGNITSKLDLLHFNMYIDLIRAAAAAPGEFRESIEVFSQPYVNGQRSEEIKHTSTIIVGKDAQGAVYVSGLSLDQKFPKIKFFFAPADMRWIRFVHKNGEPWTQAELSASAARSYANMLEELVNALAIEQYTPPPPRQPGGGYGNKGGGYNKGGNSYGGNRGGQVGGRAQPDNSDDSDSIPF